MLLATSPIARACLAATFVLMGECVKLFFDPALGVPFELGNLSALYKFIWEKFDVEIVLMFVVGLIDSGCISSPPQYELVY